MLSCDPERSWFRIAKASLIISTRPAFAVDSAEFIALKTAFDKYETALKKMPAAWQNVGQASTAAKTNFESVANNMKVVSGTLATITTNCIGIITG
jgi:hypothetical protein